MSNITAVFIDDEANALALLEEYAAKIINLEVVGVFNNALEAQAFLKKNPVAVVFSDINMPLLNGLELADLLDKNQKMVFTTAYEDYALESFNFQVVDYLLKPISFKRFLTCIEKLKLQFKEDKSMNCADTLFIKDGKKTIQLNLKDIIYIESAGEYLKIYTAECSHMVYKRMKDLTAQLPENFLRIHNSYIIQWSYMKYYMDQQIYIHDRVLPLSATYKDAFLQKIQEKLI